MAIKKAATKKRPPPAKKSKLIVKRRAPAKKGVVKKKPPAIKAPPVKKKAAASKKRAVKKVAPLKSIDKLDEYGLTTKHREFADLYRGGTDDVRGNAKRCYMRINPKAKENSSEVEGSKLLRNPKIVDYLKLKTAEIAEKCDINAEWVLRQAVKVHERCMQARPVTNAKGEQIYVDNPEGDVVPAFTFDAPGANKALEIVGKHIDVQAFKEKLDVTSGGKPIKNEWHMHPVSNHKTGG